MQQLEQLQSSNNQMRESFQAISALQHAAGGSLRDWLDADGVDETNKVTEILFFKDGSEKFLKQGNARAFLETLRDLRKQTKEPN